MYWNWSRRSPVRNGGAFFFLEQPDYQALMPLGATSEKLEIAPAKLARTVGGKPKGTHFHRAGSVARLRNWLLI